jgi:hypothetical protein
MYRKKASCANHNVADDQTRRIQCDILLLQHVRQKARVSDRYDRGSYVMNCLYITHTPRRQCKQISYITNSIFVSWSVIPEVADGALLPILILRPNISLNLLIRLSPILGASKAARESSNFKHQSETQ